MLRMFGRKLKPLNRIEVSKEIILKNYDSFLGKEFWPVIKSNAYGAGIEQIGEVLEKREFEYWVADSYLEALRVWTKSNRKVLLIGPMLAENYKYLDFRKEFLVKLQKSIPQLTILPSFTTFILVKTKVPSRMIIQDLQKVGILIKDTTKIKHFPADVIMFAVPRKQDWQYLITHLKTSLISVQS